MAITYVTDNNELLPNGQPNPDYGVTTQVVVPDPPAPPSPPPDPIAVLTQQIAGLQAQITALAGAISPVAASAVQAAAQPASPA